jgi:hypothetical protein
MSGTLSPVAEQQFFDDTGVPLAGGLLYTYASGTSTPATTYTDALLMVPHTNPIVLDSAGRAVIYLPAAAFKYVLTDANNVPIGLTIDPVTSIGLQQAGSVSVFDFEGDPNSPITAATYPIGTTWASNHAGTGWYGVDATNINPGTYNLSGMLLATTGTVTAALVNLSDGAPQTPIVTIASASTTGAQVLSGAVLFAIAGIVKTYAIKVQVSDGTGFAWNLQLVKTG